MRPEDRESQHAEHETQFSEFHPSSPGEGDDTAEAGRGVCLAFQS